MHVIKILLCAMMLTVPVFANETDDRKTATSLKYVTHELDTRQNKLTTGVNKAITYTNTAGGVEQRTVKSDLAGGNTSDTSLPTVGAVTDGLSHKQDEIEPINDRTAVTYTGQTGSIGQKGIYQDSGTYLEQSDSLIDAKTFNAALKAGLDNEFICPEANDFHDPVSGECWLWQIHNTVTSNGILPSGYTPLAYIESSGTQWIDTGVGGLDTGDWEIYVKWMITGTPTTNWAYICGAYESETANAYRIILNQTNTDSYYVSGNSRAGGGSAMVLNMPANIIHEGIIHNGYVMFDGVRYSTPVQGTAISSDKTIGLFARGAGGITKMPGRIYAAYAKQGNTMKYNYIPARNNTTGRVGMWDTVSRTFKTNSAGDDNFNAGPEVSNNIYIPQSQTAQGGN